jgi:hypothetical protein
VYSTQRLNRLYENFHQEWVAFLSKLFPSDSLAMYQFNDVRTKKDKKNERNRLYRELSNKKKGKSPGKDSNDKVSTIKHY